MSSFSVFHWIIAALGIYAVYWAIKSLVDGFRHGTSMLCTTCGHEGATGTRTRGSLGIEIVLWLCLILPGVIYSLWRLSTRAPACSSCRAATLVPSDSPVAAKMRHDLATK